MKPSRIGDRLTPYKVTRLPQLVADWFATPVVKGGVYDWVEEETGIVSLPYVVQAKTRNTSKRVR
jgi:hypothetical protein